MQHGGVNWHGVVVLLVVLVLCCHVVQYGVVCCGVWCSEFCLHMCV